MDISPLNIMGLIFGAMTLAMVFIPLNSNKSSFFNVPLAIFIVGFLAATLYPKLDIILPTDPIAANILLRITELLVVVALTGAGLSINTAPSWKKWKKAYLLVLVGMPLFIVSSTFLGHYVTELSLISALLLGVVLAPTDPVLARTVQVGGPHQESQSEPRIKVSLTAEAGLNDGFAFPFVYLAVTLLANQINKVNILDTGSLVYWFFYYLLFKVLVGLGIGVASGLLVGKLIKSVKSKINHEEFFGLFTVGMMVAIYFLAELMQGYGFLAVFAGAVTINQTIEPKDSENKNSDKKFSFLPHAFSDQLELIITCALLLWLGVYFKESVFLKVTMLELITSLTLIFLVRPLGSFVSLLFSGMSLKEKIATSFLGIKGFGSIYYLAYAQTKYEFEGLESIWRVVTLTILLSLIVHGLFSKRILAWGTPSAKD